MSINRHTEYYEKNREKRLESAKNYRKNNKEKIAKYRKEYYEKNKENIKRKRRERYQLNIEKYREYGRNWCSKNKEAVIKKNKKKRENYRKQWLQYFTEEYGSPKCEICGKGLNYIGEPIVNWDHKIGREVKVSDASRFIASRPCNSKNRKVWKDSNLGILCKNCNICLPTNLEDRSKFVFGVPKYFLNSMETGIMSNKKKVVLLGAGGREFHNFSMVFKNNPFYEVVAFTAAQIPFIGNRNYPPSLSGKLYPKGIPILYEKEISNIEADIAVFSYSDVSHIEVMNKASKILALGMDFQLLGPKSTMLKSNLPVISICATRTGCGKSGTSRYILKILHSLGKTPIVIRHPMAYRDLENQKVERFETIEDIIKAECTIEEREEYEPLINMGAIVYAGVDYKEILKQAEKEADVIVWDGGNNDFPFYKSNLQIVVTDVYRFHHCTEYHPGETNIRMADVIVVNKMGGSEDLEFFQRPLKNLNNKAEIVWAKSVFTKLPKSIKGKVAAIVEDGPTVTHGGMPYGAAYLAAEQVGCIIPDPKPYGVLSIAKAMRVDYPHMKKVIPALGYSRGQIDELEETIRNMSPDVVIYATPVDLGRIINLGKPAYKVNYELKEIKPKLKNIIKKTLKEFDNGDS